MIKQLVASFRSVDPQHKAADDAVTSQVSQAKQNNEAAVAKLSQTLCAVLDGENCPCLKLVN